MAGVGYADLFVSAADGLKLYARDYGPSLTHALPVVCLPGLARTSADFHDLALALSADEKRPRRVLSSSPWPLPRRARRFRAASS